MTKTEKGLIVAIQDLMERKRITSGDPKEMYKITKRSNKDYFAEAKIGQAFFVAKGKNIKEVIKNLIGEMK